jgi:hypothetical protein
MFHHREHDHRLTEADRQKLVSDGATTTGMVMHHTPSPDDPEKSQVRIVVRFKDGQTAEISEELDNLYQPPPGSPEAERLAEVRGNVRHPERIPKIQLPLFDGVRVPVRYDVADQSRVVVDMPALRKQALRDYIKHEQQQREPKQADPQSENARTGPPWVVPTHCPNCGAPVDQAKASRDPDPMCRFCREPIPVSPVF